MVERDETDYFVRFLYGIFFLPLENDTLILGSVFSLSMLVLVYLPKIFKHVCY